MLAASGFSEGPKDTEADCGLVGKAAGDTKVVAPLSRALVARDHHSDEGRSGNASCPDVLMRIGAFGKWLFQSVSTGKQVGSI